MVGVDGVHVVWLRRVRGRRVLFFVEAGVTLAAATVRWERQLRFLDRRLERGGETPSAAWRADSPTPFLEALIFNAVASTLRRPHPLERLEAAVEALDAFELRFWAAAFTRAYQKRGRTGLYRPARSFKTLYNIR